MKVTNQRRSDMLKRSVIFTLIMAMMRLEGWKHVGRH